MGVDTEFQQPRSSQTLIKKEEATSKKQDESSNSLNLKLEEKQNCEIERALGSPAAASSPVHQGGDTGSSPSKKPKLENQDDIVESSTGCTVCQAMPQAVPLFGCKMGHYVCNKCRKAGGVLLSCPKCLQPDLSVQLVDLEKKVFPQKCVYSLKGCKQRFTEENREEHESECEYRLVLCPCALFARSCQYNDVISNIRDHGRTQHKFNQCITRLDLGFITCKMVQKKDGTCGHAIYNDSARFPPVELQYDERLFYCYYQRRNSQGLWYFFIRLYGGKKAAKGYTCEIHLGNGKADKNSVLTADRVARVDCVHYAMNKAEIEESGCCLVVDDAAVKKMNSGDEIFRVWWKVSRKKKAENGN
eukprot:TRINITY_DN17380_c0_g1_i13.p1 TRINITY_DN17380_c0_g1~~TRINITY_DN17380_c0_g1_i13.p1  ORF type:complete len:360 (-),score=78.80 TRINITY_DN17380_c0_g1_i13:299-1378(-)